MELKIHDQEILLQKLWKSRKLFNQELRTVTGDSIEVIFAGKENLDAGPDFKDAVLKINGRLLKGDVEVHLDANGWYEHGHHADPNYNAVILHLVSEEPSGKNFVEREDGARVVQVWIDLAKQKAALWKKPDSEAADEPAAMVVADCPLSKMSETKIWNTIQEAGERRLFLKAEQLREDLAGSNWDQLIYRKLFEALGYSKNQAPFLRLSELVPYETVRDEMQWVDEEMALKKCAALLFGAAGLLPSQNQPASKYLDTATLNYVAPLIYLWEQLSHRLQIRPLKPQVWQFFRLRPQNFPTRRLAGMTQLLLRFYRPGFLSGVLKIFSGSPREYEQIADELEGVFTVKAEGFWAEHYRFDHEIKRIPPKGEAALIGKDRAREIVINIVLPALCLYAAESRDGELKNVVREIYLRTPRLAENAITRAMKYQLFTNRGRTMPGMKLAYQQQGLINLHKSFCRPLKCDECLGLAP
jgi:hypothetical protein